ncbi:MAG: hypothetical protein WA672_19425, partial [Candidatus Angelobacter sp.]
TQTERQYNPPQQNYTPAPQRQPEHVYTPPPAPVHQQAAPPPPAVHQSAPPPAPIVHQSAPPESHGRSSDEGSHGRPR